jgi:hypothetical protein
VNKQILGSENGKAEEEMNPCTIKIESFRVHFCLQFLANVGKGRQFLGVE